MGIKIKLQRALKSPKNIKKNQQQQTYNPLC